MAKKKPQPKKIVKKTSEKKTPVKLNKYSFPAEGVTIEAKNKKEALAKLADIK